MSRVEVSSGLLYNMQQIGPRAVKGVSDVMQVYAEKIVVLAREYAPVDEHNLEKAIRKNTSYAGPNRRSQIEIYVDGSVSAKNGKVVANYARLMHEQLGIGAMDTSRRYKLGKKSAMKDGGRGVVGGKYLSRAIDHYRKTTISAARQRVKTVVGNTLGGSKVTIFRS